MRTKLIKSLLLMLAVVLFVPTVIAHPGRTDANGGHWNRKTGEYHFHTGEYAGRSSSGVSSKTEYIPFTPPYDPPTNNPYKSNHTATLADDNSVSIVSILMAIFLFWIFAINIYYLFTPSQRHKKLYLITGICSGIMLTIHLLTEPSTATMLSNFFGILFGIYFVILSVCTIIEFIVNDIKDNNGIIIIIIISIILICLTIYFADEYPLQTFILISALIASVALAFMVRRLYYTVETEIDDYKKSLIDLCECIKNIKRTKKQAKIYGSTPIPKSFEIGKDNLPKDKNSESDWGNTFTLYRTCNGSKLHSKCGCCSSFEPVNVYLYRHNIHESNLCKKCTNNYTLPDMSWYESFLKYKEENNKYKTLQKELSKLREKTYSHYKKCNSIKYKILLVFRSNNKRELQNINKNYMEILNLKKLKLYNKYLSSKKRR